MRKYRSFLSPDDALRDLRKHASQGAEIRWELHTSRTDVDLASRAATKCSCHSLTPQAQREGPRRHPERGDLRKHHSAETDKWSLKPDPPEHDLRKHLSDDSRMDREHRWTLQVPEVHANPKQRCTCPKPQLALSPSPSASDEGPPGSRRHSPLPSDEEDRRSGSRAGSRLGSRSVTPTLPVPQPAGQQLLQKRPSADSRSSRERVSPLPGSVEQPVEAPQPQQPSKSVSVKGRAQPSEERRALRARWGVKPHFSLPAERKASKLVKPHDDYKSKSLKERPKYSVRRSMSPDPDRDPRQALRLDNRIVRKLISPEVSLMDAKWAPYEGHSPLPSVGMKKRETKKISDIKWVPYEESPIQAVAAGPKLLEREPSMPLDEEDGPPRAWSPFHNITPTHLPPPEATPTPTEEEAFRFRILDQVQAFPIYQGAWREESPPPPSPPPEIGTPVWSPQDPREAQLRRQTSFAPPAMHRSSPSPPPTPPPKRSTLKVRSSKKKALRAKSQESQRQQQHYQEPAAQPIQLAPPPALRSIMRASSEEPGRARRNRPQLQRSKALLDVPPHIDASKRSLSEEVRSYNRSESTKRGLIFRAKSEDAARHGGRWFADDEDPERQELREYVTTV
ncbi:serine/arginine repetitive matrix protein 1-like [Nasonia vitripennis]|uniref:Uncharacterized protein n=1 Tax=Nasonia vitripennis TaxID=7425 RepID=A0A7M7LUY2_NASVI|nr:serine/arginine repetitive matrix protein 1-like [Nasonia vitripennis]